VKVDTYTRLLWLADHPDANAKEMAYEFKVSANAVRLWAARLFSDKVLERRALGGMVLWRVRDDVRL